MKSRRNFVVAILLAAVMCIGVGFAAISSTLGLKGTINYNPAFSIEWQEDSAKLGDDALESTIGDTQFGEDTVSTLQFTIDTTDWTVGQSHIITAVIENNSKYDATNVTVSALAYTGNAGELDDYYEVTVANDEDITAGATGTVTITIKMKEYPQTDASYTGTFKFTVTAEQDIA